MHIGTEHGCEASLVCMFSHSIFNKSLQGSTLLSSTEQCLYIFCLLTSNCGQACIFATGHNTVASFGLSDPRTTHKSNCPVLRGKARSLLDRTHRGRSSNPKGKRRCTVTPRALRCDPKNVMLSPQPEQQGGGDTTDRTRGEK